MAILGSALWTVAKAPLWTSDTTLFESAIRGPNPSVRAHLNLAGAYYSDGRLLESFDTMSDAISLIDSVETSGTLLAYQRSFAYSTSAVVYQLADCDEPSLRLNPTKQVWYCDPCGIGGDAIELFMRARRIEFAEAVRELAA